MLLRYRTSLLGFTIISDQTILSGSTWNWAHNGKDTNGEVQLTENGKIRWNNGEEQGSWSYDEDSKILWATFGGVSHELELDQTLENAVLITPARNPATTMSLKYSGKILKLLLKYCVVMQI